MPNLHFHLVHPTARTRAMEAVQSAPDGMEVVIQEPKKTRTPDANAAMWAGPLRDIADQVWIGGRRFSDEVWHEHFKREYLPEEDDPELYLLVKNPETYRKWDYTPSGDRICVGSTTGLTRRGFALYVQQIEAAGANEGVMFRARETEEA